MQRPTTERPEAPEEAPPRSEAGILLEALKELPAAHAEVVALAFFGELSHAEIAARLGLSRETVNGRMRLGLEKLQRNFKRPVVPEGQAAQATPETASSNRGQM